MSKLLSVVHRAAAEVAENWNKRNSGMWGKQYVAQVAR